jgi:hypothetical protein
MPKKRHVIKSHTHSNTHTHTQMTAIQRAKEASLRRLAQKHSQQSGKYRHGDDDGETYASSSQGERDSQSARDGYSRGKQQNDGRERSALQRLIRQVLEKDVRRQSNDGRQAYREDEAEHGQDGRDKRAEDTRTRGQESGKRDRGSSADRSLVRSEYRDRDAGENFDHRQGEGQGRYREDRREETGDRLDMNIHHDGGEGGAHTDRDDATNNGDADLIGLLKNLIAQRDARSESAGRHSERQTQSESESRGSDSSRDRESNSAGQKDAKTEEGAQGNGLVNRKVDADGKAPILRKMKA